MYAMPLIWPICCGWADCPRRGSPRRRPASCGSWCAIEPSWSQSDPVSRRRSMPCWPRPGVLIAASDLFGVTGRQRLAKVPLRSAYAQRIGSLLQLIDIFDSHEARFAAMIAERLDTHTGYHAIQQVPGIGPVLAAVFVAEIGDVDRFTDPAHLCSWAGLTPTHRESDTVVHRGHITKQGSKAVRWAAVEAIQRYPTTSKIALDRTRIESRRGKNIAKIAAARKLLTLVYYGLRDGHIRALDRPRAA